MKRGSSGWCYTTRSAVALDAADRPRYEVRLTGRVQDGPPRRYYTLSAEGRKLYAELTGSWRNLVDTVERLIGEEQSKRRRAVNDPR